jgi:hypothetical protein
MKSLATVAGITSWALILGGLQLTSATDASQSDRPRKATDSRVEDIYIARSMHESKITPTAFCAEGRSGFGRPVSEDQWTFRSTATRGTDGLMIDTNVQTIGRLHGCFGSTSDPALRSFYAEGVLATVTFTGRGECRMAKADYPETGMTVSRCFLELRDLPSGYVGGQLTTNTMASRNVLGEETDPPGYTQPSIATIRLWKRR